MSASHNPSDLTSSSFVYNKEMTREKAEQIILDQLDQGTVVGTRVWLLRESSIPNALTLQYAKRMDNGQLGKKNILLCLTDDGWKNFEDHMKSVLSRAELTEITKQVQNNFPDIKLTETSQPVLVALEKRLIEIGKIKVITPEVISSALESLNSTLTKMGMDTEHRITPEKQQAAVKWTVKNVVVPSEYIAEPHSALPKPTSINLPSIMVEVFTCPVTQELLKDPVVCKTSFKTGENVAFTKGKSYERAVLEGLGLKEGEDFYQNRQLKKIMSYIGAQHDSLEKIEKIDQSEIIDTIFQTEIKNAVISPSGHSFSKDAIEKWLSTSNKNPITREPLSKADLIPNHNLDTFIGVWRNARESIVQERQTIQNVGIEKTNPKP